MNNIVYKVFATHVPCSMILPFDIKTPAYQSLSKLLTNFSGSIRINSSPLTSVSLDPHAMSAI